MGGTDELLRLVLLRELLTSSSSAGASSQEEEALTKAAEGLLLKKLGGGTGGGRLRPQQAKRPGDAQSRAFLAVSEAEVMARAQQEFAQALQQNLARLKEVIQESQQLAEKMETVLGAKGGN